MIDWQNAIMMNGASGISTATSELYNGLHGSSTASNCIGGVSLGSCYQQAQAETSDQRVARILESSALDQLVQLYKLLPAEIRARIAKLETEADSARAVLRKPL